MTRSARRIAALLALSAFAAPAARATCSYMECTTYAAGDSVLSVLGMHEMEGGKWVFEIAPGVYKLDSQPDETSGSSGRLESKGLTVGAAIKREISAHFGWGAFVGVSRQSGDGDVAAGNELAPPAAVTAGGGKAGTLTGGDGTIAGGFVTFDPFSKPDGFRLPLTVGAAYLMRSDLEFRSIGGATPVESTTISDIPSVVIPFINVSLDFILFKKLRVMPGILYGVNPSEETSFGGHVPRKTYDYVVNSSHFTGQQANSANFGSLYLGLMYRPWNLSALLQPDPKNNVTLYALKWTKKW